MPNCGYKHNSVKQVASYKSHKSYSNTNTNTQSYPNATVTALSLSLCSLFECFLCNKSHFLSLFIPLPPPFVQLQLADTEIDFDERRGVSEFGNPSGESSDQSTSIIVPKKKFGVNKSNSNSNSNNNNGTGKNDSNGTGDSTKYGNDNNQLTTSSTENNSNRKGDFSNASGGSAISTSKSDSESNPKANDQQNISPQATDDPETFYIPADYDSDLEAIISKRIKDSQAKKSQGAKDVLSDRDDLISASETRTGDTRSGQGTNVPFHFRPHDGLPAFPPPVGYIGGHGDDHGNPNHNAELTADGAGFVMEHDSSAASPAFTGPQQAEQPEMPVEPMGHPSQHNFLRPTQVIYQEVAVPVPVPVHEEVIVPVEQADAASMDTISDSPNLPFGMRHSASSTKGGNNQGFTFSVNGDAHQQIYSSLGEMSSTGKDGPNKQQLIHHQQQQQQHQQHQQQLHNNRVHPQTASQQLQGAVAQQSLPYELQYSSQVSPHLHQHLQNMHPLKSEAVNSLVQSIGKTNDRLVSVQPPVSQQHQLTAPIVQTSQQPAVSPGLLPQQGQAIAYDGKSVMRNQVQPPPPQASSTSTTSGSLSPNLIQRTPRIPLTPAAAAAAASGTRQRLPVFVKSHPNNGNSKIAAPSMPQAHYLAAASAFEQQETSLPNPSSYSSSPEPSQVALSTQHQQAQVVFPSNANHVKVPTKDKLGPSSGSIPLGMPVAGLIQLRQQQQQQQQQQHQQSKSLQSEPSMPQPVIARETLQYLPSVSGPPLDAQAAAKTTLAQRLTAQILAEQIMAFEKLNSKHSNSHRLKRDVNDKTINNDSLTGAESRYFGPGDVFDDDSIPPNVPPPLFDFNPEFHVGSSRRRSYHTGGNGNGGGGGRRNYHRRNSNPTGAESKSYGILGSGNFEVIRGGIYKDSESENHGHNYGSSHASHNRHHHHHSGGDDYDDASNKKFTSYSPLGEDDYTPKDPVFGFQGYDNFQLASNQEEDLKKHDTNSSSDSDVTSEEDHTAAASISISSTINSHPNFTNHNSLINSDQDLMAIA